MNNICIGTAQFGMDYGIANMAGKPTEAEIKKMINFIISKDITFFDTAQSYGNSEVVLGKIFRELDITDSVNLITKLEPDFTFSSYLELEKIVRTSLVKLNIDSVYGLLIHRPKIEGNWEKFIDAVGKLKENGLIKNFGVSIYHPDDAIRGAEGKEFDIIQIPFNALDRRLIDNQFFKLSMEQGKNVFLRSIFLQGLLLMNDDQVKANNMAWALEFLKEMNIFIKNNNLDVNSFILKVVAQYLPESILVLGADSYSQVEENLDILNSAPLPDNIVQEWWSNLPNYPERLLNPSMW